MNTTERICSAGLHLYWDSLGVEQLRLGGQARKRARRFGDLQRHFVSAPHQQAGVYAGRLMTLDMIAPAYLHAALASTPFRHKENAYLDWVSPDTSRLDRRALSTLTVLTKRPDSGGVDIEMQAVLRIAAGVDGYKSVPVDELTKELDRDFICWSVINLPKVLFSHVTSLRQMTALPRHLMVLDTTSLVPSVKVDDGQVEREALIGHLLDESRGRTAGSAEQTLVDSGVSVFSVSGAEEPGETIARWTKGMLALQSRLELASFPCVVTLAWLFDLAESGTVSTVDGGGTPATRARYARLGAMRLFKMLSALPADPARWTTNALEAGYLAMLADPSCNDLSGLGAAISSFQSFAIQTIGVPMIRLGIHRLIPEPKPRAQWVPANCVTRAVGWLDRNRRSDRLVCKIAALQILLGSSAPFRPIELQRLRIQNVTVTADGKQVEVEIVGLPGTDGLKTEAGTRRVLVTDPETVKRLLAWRDLRRAQGAPEHGFLFAEAASDYRLYRPYAVRAAILRVLKASTGDPSMTFYALRHSWISQQTEQLLMLDSFVDFNRLMHLADAAGHVSPATSIYFYSHRFEDALWTHMSHIVREEVRLTGPDAEVLLP